MTADSAKTDRKQTYSFDCMIYDVIESFHLTGTTGMFARVICYW